MIAALLVLALLLVCALILDALQPDALPLPERGEIYEAPAGQRVRIWSVREGRIAVEYCDPDGAGGRLGEIAEAEWAERSAEWRLVAVDPDLLIPPAREYGPRGGAR